MEKKKKRSFIFRYYKRYWLMILISLLFLVFQGVCELQLPEYMSKMVSEGIAMSDMGQIWYYGGFMLGAALIACVSAVFVGYFATKVGAAIARDMRYDCFEHVMNFASEEYDKFELSSLITRTTNDITQIQMFTIMFLRLIMFTPIMGIGGIVKASTIAVGMTDMLWVVGAALLVIVVIVALLLAVVQPKFMQMQKAIDNINRVSNDELNGLMVIRAFNTQDYEINRFDGVNKHLTGLSLFTSRTMALLMPVMMIVMNGVSIAVVWVAAYQAADVTAVGNMMAFVQYAMQIIISFMMISMIFVMLPRAIVSAKRIDEILSTEISIHDPADAQEPAGIRLTGDVAFENVSYNYGGEEPAISDISFTARHGQTTAIIGSTGSGKSTIVNLIPRLADVSSGRITVDGKDIRAYNLKDLRDNIGFVPQKNILFYGTIESNINYGQKLKDDERIRKSAEIAQAQEFIESKSDGYECEIAQGGSNVSGGQKQRLSIARALNKRAPICIFDDSFSALDYKTDSALRTSIRENLADATVIIVAQRVGTIKNAEQIIVLDEGRIVGKGTHEELLKSCSVYLDIAKSQLSEEELGL